MTQSDRERLPHAAGDSSQGTSSHNPNREEVNQLKNQVEEKDRRLAAKERELRQQAQEIETKEKEIERIAKIQQSLLPRELPEIPGVALAVSYEAPQKAGGDYFDFVPLEKHDDGSVKPEGRWLILLANGTGHEPASAVITAILNSILHAFPATPDDPAKVLEFLNHQLCGKDLDEWIATVIVAILNPLQRTLRFASAGHPPALVKDPCNGNIRELSGAQSLPLGVQEETYFKSDQIDLHSGQVLLLYTDGAIEAMDEQGEPFGMERFKGALASADGPVEKVVESLNAAITAHRGRKVQEDDKSLIALKVLA